MDKYILSKKTQEDINGLFEYGVNHFGNDKALKYLTELRTYFISIKNNPEIGKVRSEIKKDLYSVPYNSHVIFYRVFSKHVRIVRVLHGRKDIPKHFKK